MDRRGFIRRTGGLIAAAALPAIPQPGRIARPRGVRLRRFKARDRCIGLEEFPAIRAADHIEIVRCSVLLPEPLRCAGKRVILLESEFTCERGGLIWEGACGYVTACAFFAMTCQIPVPPPPSTWLVTVVHGCLFRGSTLRPAVVWGPSYDQVHPFPHGPEDRVLADGSFPIGPNLPVRS